MNSGRRVLFLCAALLACASTRAFADQFVNGGFETGDFTGWTQGGNFTFTGVAGYAAHTGTFGAVLGPVGSDGLLSQTLTDVFGSTYTVSFYEASGGDTPNDFNVTINGHTLFSIVDDPSHAHSLHTVSFTSIGTDTFVFGFRNDPDALYLDDVSLSAASAGPSAVPEPSSLALLGTGMLGVLGAARRRFAKV